MTAGPNTGALRAVTITIAGQTVEVQQPGPTPASAPNPPVAPNPTPAPVPAPAPSPTPAPPPLTLVDLTGDVNNLEGHCPTIQFTLGESHLTVRTTPATLYTGGSCKDVTEGIKVEVRGLELANTLTAGSIDIKDHQR